MVHITLADFLDFVSKSGSSKLSKVKRLKHRPPYRPRFDYYRPLRETIAAVHRAHGDRAAFDAALMAALPEEFPIRSELLAVGAAYRAWWGRKQLGWFEPPRVIWTQGEIAITINPDLGLIVDGRPHLMKLWFRDVALEKRGLDVVFQLMEDATPGLVPPGTEVGVLDVRRSHLFSPTVEVSGASAWLNGEVAYLSAAWADV